MNWTMNTIKALVLLCVVLAGGWGYQRIDSLSTQLQTAQESVQTLQSTMASQKALDATRIKLDKSVRDLHKEIETTNQLARKLFDATNHTALPDPVIDGLQQGCANLGVACLPN
jgi:outer membrane murein-binding lipoprotein Lpp